MKHSEPIGLSATCSAMLLSAGSDNMYISFGAMIIGVTSLILINRYYMKILKNAEKNN